MNHPRSSALSLFLLLLCSVAGVFADVGERSNSMDNTDFSTRETSMGSVFTGDLNDVSSLLSNPAGLGEMDRGGVVLHSRLGLVETFQETLVVGLPLGDGKGLGFSGTYLNYGTFEGRDDLGSLTPSYGANRVTLRAGGGMEVLKDLFLGLAVRVSRQDWDGSSNLFLSPKFGLLMRPTQDMKIGFSYHLGGWGTASTPLSSSLNVDSSWEFPLNPSFGFLAALGCSSQTNGLFYLQGGLEFSLDSRYFLRAGYKAALEGESSDGLSAGMGVALAGFALDYAFLPSGELGSAHRFSIGYPFPDPGKSPDVNVKSSANRSPDKSLTPSDAGGVKNIPDLVADPPKGGQPISGIPPSDPRSTTAPGTSPKPVGNEGNKDRLTLQFNIPEDFTGQGDEMMAQGRYKEAASLYEEAVKENEGDTKAWWALGKAYAHSGLKIDAIRCFERVLKLQPENKSLASWLERYKAATP